MEAINGKHIVEEINGTRCSVIDKAASAEKAEFIRNVLQYNKYTVLMEENVKKTKDPEDTPVTYKVGVTDITFLLPVALYLRKILNPLTGNIADELYWMQGNKKHE